MCTAGSAAQVRVLPSTVEVMAEPSQRGRRERPRILEPGRVNRDVAELHIHLLGRFQVSVGDRYLDDSAWYLCKAGTIVKLLALAPGHRMEQGQLIDLLWPERDRPAASQLLTKALLLVQRVLEPELPVHLPSSYLHWEGDEIVLAPPGGLWIDVEAFVHAAQAALWTKDPGDCEQALRLYGGDLLPNDRFESWTMEPRQWLQTLRLSLFSCAVSGWRGA